MLLYGASGHAKVIIDCLETLKLKIDGLFDDDLKKYELLGYKVLGSYNANIYNDSSIILSIGDNQLRKLLSGKITHQFAKVIHPSATISKTVLSGLGTVILHNSTIQSGTTIGNHAIINTKASVDHDCVIGDYVHIAPNATLCGGITVENGTFIGAGSVILPNTKIGKWVTVGAGSVVIKDIPDYAVVVGNPGRVIKYNNYDVK